MSVPRVRCPARKSRSNRTRCAWRIFDFLVIGISLLPASGALSILRALRVLRVLRLVSIIPSMRRVVGGLFQALPSMGSIFLLLMLVFYVFAVMLVDAVEIERRKGDGIPAVPPDATPWQRLYRRTVNSLAEGATLDGATDFRQIAKTPPRHNH